MTEIARIVQDAKLPATYGGMVAAINEAMPAIRRDSASFNKSHSQFMYSMLDVTHLTTVRAVKHTLAEIDRTRRALEEAYITQRRRSVDLREAAAKLKKEREPFARERLEIDITEAQMQSAAADEAVQGAVRKLSYMVAQYKSLMVKLGKDELTEADYEADEPRYHIMTVLKQALCAARARGGVIDEGNQIYIFEMGLPAAEVQAEVLAFLQREQQMLARKQVSTHDMVMDWMEACAERWKDCARAFAERRGVPMVHEGSLHSLRMADAA